MDLAIYDLGFSFFLFHRASSETPATFTTLKRQPGISPLDLPRLPKPATRTSSCNHLKEKKEYEKIVYLLKGLSLVYV